MLDELRNAWHEAVRNFRRELSADDHEGADQTAAREDRGVRATIQAAERELRRLEDELRNARRHLEEERVAAERCYRRESLARSIGDTETAELGARFGARHAEKAVLLERKADVLGAELEMREREMDEMRAALAAHRRASSGSAPSDSQPDTSIFTALEEDLQGDADFRDLQQQQREREAAARVEELKRRRS